MQPRCGKTAIMWRELEQVLETSTLLRLKQEVEAIRYGYKLKPDQGYTFIVADESGSVHHYRLTIILDSLAGSEKNANGMTTTGKPGENIE